MQNTINKEIRRYQESVLMGMDLRQTLCSGVAVGMAAGSYFLLDRLCGRETASWLCILVAAPAAAAGFFRYDGLNFEQFLCTVWKTEVRCAGNRLWKAENRFMRKPGKRKENAHAAE